MDDPEDGVSGSASPIHSQAGQGVSREGSLAYNRNINSYWAASSGA